MLICYKPENGRMVPGAEPAAAVWIDLCRPDPQEIAVVEALGVSVPTLADMEEIEISNRLYHEDDAHHMTVVLSGQTEAGQRMAGPVSFILTPERLVTVRHHAPRPFETYPARAGKAGAGCASPAAVLLGLFEEVVGRAADHLEETGRSLDTVSATIYAADAARRSQERLLITLQRVGREGEMLSKMRLGLLTLSRALVFFQQLPEGRASAEVAAGLMHDIQSLEIHADFLGQRVALSSDTTLGMIDLAQNATVKIVSVVSALFLPPTLIASIYGMNFRVMPELEEAWGYPAALVVMVLSAALSWAWFKWKRWL